MSAGLGPWGGQEAHRARVEQVAENNARLAWSYAQVGSTGWGEMLITTPVTFAVTFLEKPIVSYGYELIGKPPVSTRFPRCHGFVTEWIYDLRGRYWIGCKVALVVETKSSNIETTAAEPNYSIQHHFTFAGVAYKSLPSTLLAD